MNWNRRFYNLVVVAAMMEFALFRIAMQMTEALGIADRTGRFCCFLSAAGASATALLTAGIGGRFLDEEMNLSIPKMLHTVLLHTAIAGVFWWVLTALLYMRTDYANETDMDTFFECLAEVLERPYYSVIYQLVFSMALFYPLLKRIANRQDSIRYILWVSFGLCMLNPLLEKIPYIKYLALFTEQINWQFATAYTFYLFVAIYVARVEIRWECRVGLYCLGALSTVVIYTLTVIDFENTKIFSDEWLSENSVFVSIQTAAVLVVLKQLAYNKSIRQMPNKILNALGRCGYAFVGAYTIVELIIAQVFTFETYAMPIALIAKWLVCLTICVAMCLGAQHMPILSYLSNDPGEDIL